MDKHVLIVHPDSGMAETIREIVHKVGQSEGYELSTKLATTQKAAEKLARGTPFELVIIAAEIAQDERSMVAPGERNRRGLELIRTLRKANPQLPAVLTTGQIDNEIYDFKQSQVVGLVREGSSFDTDLTKEVQDRLRDKAVAGQTPEKVDLEITLDPNHGGCFYQFYFQGQPYSPHMINVDAKKLADLVLKSRKVPNAVSDWEKQLNEVGEALAEQLFQGTPANEKFLKTLIEFKGVARGLDNVRIRFVVTEKLDPIALEALKEKGEEYWMLQTPIYRRMEQRVGHEPRVLFLDEETRTRPINVLIIQAEVPDGAYAYVREGQLKVCLEFLPCIKEETEALQKQLLRLKQRISRRKGTGISIGRVRLINQENIPHGISFSQEVENTLLRGRWHIVHYSGHTYYDYIKNIGYVFFPREASAEVDPVAIDRFSWWLERTRFVFLSSCTSAEQDFLFHLAKERVPAIIGFRWIVDDDKAKEYAGSFYRNLFGGEERSLEYAYLRAKKEMKVKYGDNPIWACPVLVMEAGPQEPRRAA